MNASKGFVAVAGTLTGLLLPAVVAAPALAAKPVVNRADCEASGGTFAHAQGVKTCTTTTQDTTTTPGTRTAGILTATFTVVTVYAITTTQTQKGNGEVTTDTNATVLSQTVTAKTCRVDIYNLYINPNECEQAGLYPTF